MPSTLAGEQKAWGELAARDSGEVSRRVGVEYLAEEQGYRLPIFAHDHLVQAGERKIAALGHHHFHLEDTTHAQLLAPLYLNSCASVEPSGTLVAPQSLPGAGAFFKGPYELPLEVLAHHFGSNPKNFLRVGQVLGSGPVDHGDAAVTLAAFPRLPITVILWVGDLEFPARVQLLLDETAPLHFSLDALWATMMMTAQVMIQVGGPHH